MLQTVRQHYKVCIKKQVGKDELDRKTSGLLCHTSSRDLKCLVSSNNLYDCPITIHNVKSSHTIFGPDILVVRSKIVWHNPDHVTIDYVAIPRYFLKFHQYVDLVGDVMFVKNVIFMITMSCGIIFITVGHVTTCTAKQLIKSLKIIICLYSRGDMFV